MRAEFKERAERRFRRELDKVELDSPVSESESDSDGESESEEEEEEEGDTDAHEPEQESPETTGPNRDE